MIAFAEALGTAELTCIPPTTAWTANGCTQTGWLSGPVSAEVHHWLVGRARPASSLPACTGVLLGLIPAGVPVPRLPPPPGAGTAMDVSAAPSLIPPGGGAPGGEPPGAPAVHAVTSSRSATVARTGSGRRPVLTWRC